MARASIKGLPPIHPGEYLKDIVLPALDTTTQGFAQHLGVSRQTLYDIMDGSKNVTAQMALRLAKATGTRAEVWMNLQVLHDLKIAEVAIEEQLAKITRLPEIAAAAGTAEGKVKVAGVGGSIVAAKGEASARSTAKARGAGVILGGKAAAFGSSTLDTRTPPTGTYAERGPRGGQVTVQTTRLPSRKA